MPEPLTIKLLQSTAYRSTDTLAIEVDGQRQPDRIVAWSNMRERMGYGYGTPAECPYGFGAAMGYGEGVYGYGAYGVRGAEVREHETVRTFEAGDYTIRIKAIDQLGNEGDWSAAYTHQHRPQPPRATNLSLDNGSLTGEIPA